MHKNRHYNAETLPNTHYASSSVDTAQQQKKKLTDEITAKRNDQFEKHVI